MADLAQATFILREFTLYTLFSETDITNPTSNISLVCFWTISRQS